MTRALARAIAIATVVATRAFADEPVADQTFQQAVALRDAGKFAESCALFRQSLELNPNAIGTLLNVARCDEEDGHIGSAVRRFTDARDRATEQNLAAQHAAAVEHLRLLVPRAPHLRLIFAAPLPAGARITVDDVPIDPNATGDLLVDPGFVHIVVSAPGFVTFETRLPIAEREQHLQPIPKLAPPVTVANPRRLVGKILTFVGTGGGLAALGIAIGAKLDYNHQRASCMELGGAIVCPPNTSNRANNDHTLGNLATGIGIGGVVVGVVGATLWFLSPNREPRHFAVAPVIAPGQAGLAAGWTF